MLKIFGTSNALFPQVSHASTRQHFPYELIAILTIMQAFAPANRP